MIDKDRRKLTKLDKLVMDCKTMNDPKFGTQETFEKAIYKLGYECFIKALQGKLYEETYQCDIKKVLGETK